jgi:hypothetical protein
MPPFPTAQGAEFDNLHLIADLAVIGRIVSHKLSTATDVFLVQGMLNQSLNENDNSLVGLVADDFSDQHTPVSIYIKLCHGLCSQLLFALNGLDSCDAFFNNANPLSVFELRSCVLKTEIEKLFSKFIKLFTQLRGIKFTKF